MLTRFTDNYGHELTGLRCPYYYVCNGHAENNCIFPIEEIQNKSIENMKGHRAMNCHKLSAHVQWVMEIELREHESETMW